MSITFLPQAETFLIEVIMFASATCSLHEIQGRDGGKWIHLQQQFTTEMSHLLLGISSDVPGTQADSEPSAHLSDSAGPNGHTPSFTQGTHAGWYEYCHDNSQHEQQIHPLLFISHNISVHQFYFNIISTNKCYIIHKFKVL